MHSNYGQPVRHFPLTRPDRRNDCPHQKAAAALMIALKCKLRLEDDLGGKAYGGDDP
jgi:hypothetical protein